jgi:DNA repair protein RecO (recombination protein O)
MIESAHGVVLRTRLLTETSLIVHWLTPDFGRMATVAKGARRVKSPFAGKLDLFYEADFSFSRSRRSELHNLREVNLRKTNLALRENILKLQHAAYAANFIEQTTETESPLPEVFELLREFLERLCGEKSRPQLVFAFELKLLRELGLKPDWTQTSLAAGTKKIAEILARDNWAAASRLKLTESQLVELRQFLHGFLIFHLGKLPKGRAVALAEKS